jgi:GNAT superfamily N-acetyltransferase
MVHELAAYEREPQSCQLTVEQLDVALFGLGSALFGTVAEIDGTVGGYALWFRNFSTWRGVSGIYLEDLYVQPEHRGQGLGRGLLTRLAGIAVERGYARVEWSVLDWNTPSIDFYRALGATPLDEWTTYRLTGPALDRRAAENSESIHSRDPKPAAPA